MFPYRSGWVLYPSECPSSMLAQTSPAVPAFEIYLRKFKRILSIIFLQSMWILSIYCKQITMSLKLSFIQLQQIGFVLELKVKLYQFETSVYKSLSHWAILLPFYCVYPWTKKYILLQWMHLYYDKIYQRCLKLLSLKLVHLYPVSQRMSQFLWVLWPYDLYGPWEITTCLEWRKTVANKHSQ